MGNCVSDAAYRNAESDDEKIITSQSGSELQGLIQETINVKYVSNGDAIDNTSISNIDYANGYSGSRILPLLQPLDFQHDQKFMWGSAISEDERIIVMHNPKFSDCERKPRKLANTNNVTRNIAAPSQQRAAGRNVRRLKVVISAKELRELLNSNGAAHNSSQAAFVSVVLKKLSLKGERSSANGGMVMRNSKPSCISTRSLQGKGNYDSNCHAWRPLLEDIPEDFTQN